MKIKYIIQWVIGALLDVIIFPLLILISLSERYKYKKGNNRVLIGTMHINNLVYVAEALRMKGYHVSCIPWIIPVHERGVIKYDMDISKKWPRFYKNWIGQRVLTYGFFIWAIQNFDIFLMPFLNRLLDRTILLKWWEFYFLKIAKKKIILNPFGSDVATPKLRWENEKNKCVSIYDGWINDPNYCNTNEKFILKNRIFCEKNADRIIAALDLVDYLQKIDDLIQLRCINLAKIKPKYISKKNDILKIIHAPNHRSLKGTEELIEAVDCINKPFKSIDLIIIENVSNSFLLNQIETCDIVADQFLVGAYGRLAIESMALGKPVMCYLREDLKKIYDHWEECPIVNTSLKNIEEKLKWFLGLNIEHRLEISKKSRRYVEKFHSYEYVGSQLDKIIRELNKGLYKL